MATALDRLKQSRDDLIVALANETAYQAAHGPRPEYSRNGVHYDWPGWRDATQREIEAFNRLIQAEQPFIVVSRGRS